MLFVENRLSISCHSGGTGRRTGLKILRDLYSRTGSIPVCGIIEKVGEALYLQRFSYFFCFKKFGHLLTFIKIEYTMSNKI